MKRWIAPPPPPCLAFQGVVVCVYPIPLVLCGRLSAHGPNSLTVNDRGLHFSVPLALWLTGAGTNGPAGQREAAPGGGEGRRRRKEVAAPPVPPAFSALLSSPASLARERRSDVRLGFRLEAFPCPTFALHFFRRTRLPNSHSSWCMSRFPIFTWEKARRHVWEGWPPCLVTQLEDLCGLHQASLVFTQPCHVGNAFTIR